MNWKEAAAKSPEKVAIRQNQNGTKTVISVAGLVYSQDEPDAEFRPSKAPASHPRYASDNWEPVPKGTRFQLGKPVKAKPVKGKKLEEAVVSQLRGLPIKDGNYLTDRMLNKAGDMRRDSTIQTLAELSLEFLRRGNTVMASEVATTLVRYMDNGEEA